MEVVVNLGFIVGISLMQNPYWTLLVVSTRKQLEVSRTFAAAFQLSASKPSSLSPSTLPTATPAVTGDGQVRLALAPSSAVPTLVVDTVKTIWTTNPFGAVTGSDVSSTAIVEFTVRNSLNGLDVPLGGNDSSDSEVGSSEPPFVFWMSISPGQ